MDRRLTIHRKYLGELCTFSLPKITERETELVGRDQVRLYV